MFDQDGPPGPPDDLPTAESSPPESAPEADRDDTFDSPTPPDDIITDIFPGGEIHFLSGASGAGKTAWSASFLKALEEGAPVLSGFTARRPAHIGILASDRPWKDHAKWFAAAGLPDIAHYSLIDDPAFVDGSQLRSKRTDRFKLFVAALDRLWAGPPPFDSLTIVDPISLFLGGNPLDYDRVYSYLLDINQLCIRCGCTILALAHTGKQKADPADRYTRPQDRILGTTAQTGCAGTTFHLSPPSETGEDWYELAWMPHHAPAGVQRLERDDQTGLFKQCAFWAPSAADKADDEKRAAVLSQLPADGSDIANKDLLANVMAVLNLKKAMAYRHIQKAAALRLIIQTRPGHWRLAKPN